MAIDIDKMRQAFEHVKQADQLLSDAGVYDANCHTPGSMKDLYEDLEMDLVRAEAGDLEDEDD